MVNTSKGGSNSEGNEQLGLMIQTTDSSGWGVEALVLCGPLICVPVCLLLSPCRHSNYLQETSLCLAHHLETDYFDYGSTVLSPLISLAYQAPGNGWIAKNDTHRDSKNVFYKKSGEVFELEAQMGSRGKEDEILEIKQKQEV